MCVLGGVEVCKDELQTDEVNVGFVKIKAFHLVWRVRSGFGEKFKKEDTGGSEDDFVDGNGVALEGENGVTEVALFSDGVHAQKHIALVRCVFKTEAAFLHGCCLTARERVQKIPLGVCRVVIPLFRRF